jgi:hypothetical protein
MRDERTDALIKFIRRFAKLSADVPALKSLLETYAETKKVPDDWRDKLEELRRSDTYAAILREFDPVISMIQSSSVDERLIAQLLKMSEGKLPN